MAPRVDARVIAPEDDVEEEYGELWRANRRAAELYLEEGVVARVEREDGEDAGVEEVRRQSDGSTNSYHHGKSRLDARRIERRRDDGTEVGLLDLEAGELLLEPTAERQWAEKRAAPTIEEVRDRFRGDEE